MAGHRLIDEYLATLARRLPADTVAEPAEFGTPDVVLAAFTRPAPGQRMARWLLCFGPVVGVCWAVALVTGHWPVPVALRVAFGTALLTIVAMLGYAATSRRGFRRTRVAAAYRISVP